MTIDEMREALLHSRMADYDELMAAAREAWIKGQTWSLKHGMTDAGVEALYRDLVATQAVGAVAS